MKCSRCGNRLVQKRTKLARLCIYCLGCALSWRAWGRRARQRERHERGLDQNDSARRRDLEDEVHPCGCLRTPVGGGSIWFGCPKHGGQSGADLASIPRPVGGTGE